MISLRRDPAPLAAAGAFALLAAAFVLLAPASHAEESSAKAEVGKPAPAFELVDLDGKAHRLGDYAGKVVVLEWFNPGCPFVVKHHQKRQTMSKLYAKYEDQGVVWLAINSGSAGKQGAGAEANQKAKEDWNIPYPICLDESGDVGRAYEAKTSPHMYVIDREGVLRYAGAIDDERALDREPKVNYVEQALEAVLAGQEVEIKTSRPYGCSVKYAPKK